MADRTYLRDPGPRAVDAGSSSRKDSSRRRHDSGDKEHRRAKRDSRDPRSPKKESNHRRKHSPSRPEDGSVQRARFELDIIGQPPGALALGMPAETSVMLSLRLPSSDRSVSAEVDTSKLLAVSSLVADSRSGERVPLESGIMTGQKMFDSLHSIPDGCADRLASNEPCRLALGYFSFPGLLIRQSGTYRIRTTLIKMSSSGGGGTSVAFVDSEPIRIERRNTAAPRRQ
ncbi:hypothetical protein Tdes44962_MAKER08340 [Teratosphaeria destructans]|uniref:Velvet domain-containing protein n=1 Tax=Teratosphaeria destructans TaxID=418781 RepID=A0A9W7W4J9_9PEZI|nr:hypothetical protein Tdes44962_MAKER08340 [Teratosphaeria destructans]